MDPKTPLAMVIAALGCCCATSYLTAADTATATATVTVDGSTFAFSGGSCVKNGSGLAVNFGMPSTPGSARTQGDYFGASIEKVPGHFENGVVSFIKDDKSYSIVDASGEATVAGASFSGTLMRGGIARGSFSC